jgi:hypothetical protein
MWVADNSASTAAVDEQAPVPAATGKRVWVVKVVRREAIVSVHLFRMVFMRFGNRSIWAMQT